MKYRISFLFLFLIISGFNSVLSQSIGNNSEYLKLKALPDDTSKVLGLFSFVESIIDTIPVESREVSEYGLSVAASINFKKGEALFNNIIGISYYNVSEPAYAMEYYLKALILYENLLKEDSSDIQLNKLFHQTKNNIAILYSDIGQYKDALKYFSSCLDYSQKAGDERMTTIYLNNIGRLLMLTEQYDKSKEYLKQAIQLALKNGFDRANAFSLSNIAELESRLNNYDSALNYYFNANVIYEKIGERYEIANNYYEIAKIYLKLNDYKSASKYSRLLSEQTDLLEDIYMKKSYYYINSEIEFKKGNYRKAYEYRIKYDDIKDSISSSDLKREQRYIDVQQELFSKEKENRELQKQFELEEEKKNTRNVFFLFLIFVSVAISALVLLYLRHQKKINKILSEKYSEIEEQKNSLNRLNSLKDKLFSIISHDLRNPFNSLLGFSEMLVSGERKYTENEKVKMLNNIHFLIKNTYFLIENILYWSRTQSSELKPSESDFNFSESLNKILLLAEQWSRNKKLSIKSQISGDLNIFTDKEMLSIVLRNLINNAIKYSHKNGVI